MSVNGKMKKLFTRKRGRPGDPFGRYRLECQIFLTPSEKCNFTGKSMETIELPASIFATLVLLDFILVKMRESRRCVVSSTIMYRMGSDATSMKESED